MRDTVRRPAFCRVAQTSPACLQVTFAVLWGVHHMMHMLWGKTVVSTGPSLVSTSMGVAVAALNFGLNFAFSQVSRIPASGSDVSIAPHVPPPSIQGGLSVLGSLPQMAGGLSHRISLKDALSRLACLCAQRWCNLVCAEGAQC